MYLLNLRMAGRTGGRDVGGVDGAARVRVRQNMMRRMARCARRGHGQPLLEQPHAMDALRVILENPIHGDIALLLHRSALAMTLAGNKWNTNGVHRRIGMPGRKDIVGAMARLTTGRERIAFLSRLSM